MPIIISSQSHSGRSGFTLVEVMFAVFLISFGLIAVIGMFSSSVSMSSGNEEKLISSEMERDAIGQIKTMHRFGNGAIALTLDENGAPWENYFFYPNPAGGSAPGYYCCYTVLPLPADSAHPEFEQELDASGTVLLKGAAVVTMRFIREDIDNPITPGDLRNKPKWDERIPAGEQIGTIRVFRLMTGGR